jgi:hypothetical protein
MASRNSLVPGGRRPTSGGHVADSMIFRRSLRSRAGSAAGWCARAMASSACRVGFAEDQAHAAADEGFGSSRSRLVVMTVSSCCFGCRRSVDPSGRQKLRRSSGSSRSLGTSGSALSISSISRTVCWCRRSAAAARVPGKARSIVPGGGVSGAEIHAGGRLPVESPPEDAGVVIRLVGLERCGVRGRGAARSGRRAGGAGGRPRRSALRAGCAR